MLLQSLGISIPLAGSGSSAKTNDFDHPTEETPEQLARTPESLYMPMGLLLYIKTNLCQHSLKVHILAPHLTASPGT